MLPAAQANRRVSAGIDCAGKTARQRTRADYGRFDLPIGMDRAALVYLLASRRASWGRSVW